MPKSEASELPDDEGQVGGAQSIEKEQEKGDPGGGKHQAGRRGGLRVWL